MEEQIKIETESKTYRLPVDVIGMLERWAEESGQKPTQVLINVLRAHGEDEKSVLQRVNVLQKEGEDVLQATNVLQIEKPRDRDCLADAITVLMYETRDCISERGQISALGVARARVYKAGPEYQARRVTGMGVRVSPYEDEKGLAERLEADDAA